MSRPIRLTPGGPWYLKQRTPADVLGKVTGLRLSLPIGDSFATVKINEAVQVSLRTKDIHEAKERHAKADAALRSFWDAHRQGPKPLSHREIIGLAGEFYRYVVAEHEDNPGTAERWHHEKLRSAIARLAGFDPTGKGLAIKVSPETKAGHEDQALADLYQEQLTDLLNRKALLLDDGSRLSLLREIGKAFEQAAGQLERNAEGDYRPDPDASRFGPWVQPSTITGGGSKARKAATLTIAGLAEAYLKACEGRRKANTIKRYRASLASLASFTKARDATSLTSDDLYDWAVHRRDKEDIGPGTINRNDLVAASSLYEWAKSRDGGRKVIVNPVTKDIRIEEPRKVQTRGMDFRDDEVQAILRASLAVKHKPRNPTASDACRWCPWLAAYTGARITELTSLRGTNVRIEAGFPMLDFGDTKTNDYRMVPVHPHLVEMGFMDFAKSKGDKPLFYDPSRHSADSETPPAEVRSRKVADWVRDVTGLDMAVKSNHAWRHTWATKATEAGIEEVLRFAITGHSDAHVGRGYNQARHSAGILSRAMAKYPRYDIS